MQNNRPRFSRVPTIALRLIAYFAVAWGTIAVLANGLFRDSLLVAVAAAAYFTIPLLVFMRRRGWPFYPSAAFRLAIVRPFWYAQLMLPLVAAGGIVGLVGGAPFGHALIAGRVVATIVFGAVALILLAGYLGSKRLVVREVALDVPGLGPEFDGMRIVQLSDLHIGPHTPKRFLTRVRDTTRALAPDLIAVTGDLIDDRAEDVQVYAKMLGGLEAPLGVYMIPGNHDVYAGWDDVERALRSAKLGTVLVNATTLIEQGESMIAVAGTGDPAGGRRGTARAAPDIERTLANIPPQATVIAFAHNPALWPALAKRGVALTLSGHTHWGQLALPRLSWSLASPFLEHAMGAHREENSLLYISPGTGYWGIPFRLGANPEITLLTLRASDAAAARVGRAVSARRLSLAAR